MHRWMYCCTFDTPGTASVLAGFVSPKAQHPALLVHSNGVFDPVVRTTMGATRVTGLQIYARAQPINLMLMSNRREKNLVG